MHSRTGKLGVFQVVLLCFPALAIALDSGTSPTAPPLVNWSAPAAYASKSRIHALNDISNPVPFIEISPCRQYNSTGTPLLQGVNRTVTLTGAPCGIPPSAVAVSVNITVFNITGATGNGVFKVDNVSPPTVAWINYPPTETQRANAGTVALNATGQIVVQVAQGAGQVDFIVDVNGYYADTSAGTALNPGEYFWISGSVDGPVIRGLNASGNFGTGVDGVALASSGVVYGVSGLSFSPSNDAAGVIGSGATVRPLNAYDFAGVRGESDVHTGVLGVSEFQGVAGSVIDTTGTEQAYGVAGFNPGTIYGLFAGGALAATGAKAFVEPHPNDPSKVIRYVSLEGPEAGTYFRGRGKFQDGVAAIEVPEDFRMVTDSEGLGIQVTPIGNFASVAVVRMALDEIVVKASQDVEFFYTVNGVRRTHKDWKPIGPGNEFAPRSSDARMPAYLTEGQKALLISNGTYRADGTVNMETAQRLGWTKIWADRKAQAGAATLESQNAAGANQR